MSSWAVPEEFESASRIAVMARVREKTLRLFSLKGQTGFTPPVIQGLSSKLNSDVSLCSHAFCVEERGSPCQVAR